MSHPPVPIAADHPNLTLALGRLRRLQWLWAALCGALGALALAGVGWRQPFPGFVWLVIAGLLVWRVQPILLALLAVAWGFSLILLVPGVQALIGADPITRLFGGSTVEILVLGLVRLLLLVTAWNQFLFYRMLYGTAGASGLDESLPAIPSVILNPSDSVAHLARLIGFLAVIAALAAIPLSAQPIAVQLLSLTFGLSIFAVGLGLGAAFTPTTRRTSALIGVGLGCLALLLALLIGRALFPG